ncbi:MAG: hypothetical protein ABSA49_05465 [Rhizomicrobium sp.]
MVPKLGELATPDTCPWFWANCPLPCAHYAAIPVEAVIERLGPEASSDVLRRNLKCVVCGHKGATLSFPSSGGADKAWTRIPMDRVPAWAKTVHRRHR